MVDDLIKYDFYRGAQKLGELWHLRRDTLKLTCVVSTHRLGWELRLGAGSNFTRSEVCKTKADVFAVAEKWKAEALKQGWSEAAPVATEPGGSA